MHPNQSAPTYSSTATIRRYLSDGVAPTGKAAVLLDSTPPRGAATKALAKRLPTIKATAACWREREQLKRILPLISVSCPAVLV